MGGWSERVMGQKGFFDVERRLDAISALGDPLETIKKIVPWEDFRTDIEAVTETELEEPVPDATTIWLFREALAQAGLIDKLFERFGQHLEAEGYIARGGQIIDATIVSVPRQRNTKEENETIRAGKTPEGWEQQPAKNAQKDKDARWTKKNDASFFGYKNHLGVDKAHKLIRKWDATDAAVHDSQKLDDVLDLSNTGNGVWADSAYRSVQIEAGLTAKGLQSHIHRRAARNRPLSVLQRSAWSPARHLNHPRSGAHLGTSPALVRSAKGRIAKTSYCSRCLNDHSFQGAFPALSGDGGNWVCEITRTKCRADAGRPR